MSNPSKLTAADRKAITKAFAGNDILEGRNRGVSKPIALNEINRLLDKAGFYLEMVTGDTILGEKGQRILPITRGEGLGGQRIENAGIVFVWENLSGDQFNPRYEFLAYIS